MARVGPFERDMDGAGSLVTDLSAFPNLDQFPSQPILVLNPWSLDASLVTQCSDYTPFLVLDRTFFVRHPMSRKRIDFIVGYAKQL